MRAALRWLGLFLLAGVALQAFFVGRVALMAVVAPQSTAFERSQAWQIATGKGELPWRQEWVNYPQISERLKRAVIASHPLEWTEKHRGLAMYICDCSLGCLDLCLAHNLVNALCEANTVIRK